MERYEDYKDSGVEWIGEIPRHWSVKRLQYISEIENSGVWGEDEPFEGAFGIPIPTTAQLSPEGRWNYDGMTIRYLSEEEKDRYLCKVGDVVVVKSSGSATNIITGKCGYINETDDGKFGFSNFLLRVRTTNDFLSRLTYYLLKSNLTRQRIERMVSATTYPNLKVDEYVKSEFPIPPLHEQEQIVAYLDEKTTLIDDLIAKTERKIALLKEKRTALINQAVTKGLDPNVEMKDSGIEWIGEIPRHWVMKQLKHIIKNLDSGTSVNSEDIPVNEPHELGVLKTSCVLGDLFRPELNKRILPNEYNRVKCPVVGNAIIFSRMNTHELVGSNGFVEEDLDNLYLPDRLWITQFFENIDLCVKWLSYVTISRRFRSELSSRSTGTSPSMKNISKDDLLTMIVAFPECAEQEQIVEYLDEQTSIIDTTIATEEKRIELLKEYRQALISEVVTGKVKVASDD